MYNRYIRNDHGTYTRIPQEEPNRPPPTSSHKETNQEEREKNHTTSQSSAKPVNGENRWTDGLTGFLRHILDQLHLDHVDTGDLLLLILLFFLFREDADEELLVALGLLLIL